MSIMNTDNTHTYYYTYTIQWAPQSPPCLIYCSVKSIWHVVYNTLYSPYTYTLHTMSSPPCSMHFIIVQTFLCIHTIHIHKNVITQNAQARNKYKSPQIRISCLIAWFGLFFALMWDLLTLLIQIGEAQTKKCATLWDPPTTVLKYPPEIKKYQIIW